MNDGDSMWNGWHKLVFFFFLNGYKNMVVYNNIKKELENCAELQRKSLQYFQNTNWSKVLNES